MCALRSPRICRTKIYKERIVNVIRYNIFIYVTDSAKIFGFDEGECLK